MHLEGLHRLHRVLRVPATHDTTAIAAASFRLTIAAASLHLALAAAAVRVALAAASLRLAVATASLRLAPVARKRSVQPLHRERHMRQRHGQKRLPGEGHLIGPPLLRVPRQGRLADGLLPDVRHVRYPIHRRQPLSRFSRWISFGRVG